MNSTLKTPLLLLAVLFNLTSYGQEKKEHDPLRFPFTEKHWAPVTKNVEFTQYKGAQVVKSNDGNAFGVMLKDVDFTKGTIEFDVELKGPGFPGINFRVSEDSLNSEIFYLRHFGKPDPMLRTTMQYAAVIDGVNLWDLTDDYQAATTLHESKWNHVRLVVSEKQLQVYVNDMDTPALRVPSLEGLTSSGGIGLTGNVIYANFKLTPEATESLPAEAGYDPTSNDPRYLRRWQMTEPIDFPFGKDLMMGIPMNPGVTIDPAYLDSTAIWKPIKASNRALVNLTTVFGNTENGQRRLTWLKTTVSSEKAQEKLLRIGFSDEVWVFINGQPLYIDKNYYGSPGMKEPKGRATLDNTSFEVPLEQGDNDILIGLTNYFYGWGIIARFEDTQGIKFN